MKMHVSRCVRREDAAAMNEEEIRARLRRLIVSDALPCPSSHDLWAGHGTDHRCAACDESITKDQLEFEVEVELPMTELIVFFHGPCHNLWLDECRKAGKL